MDHSVQDRRVTAADLQPGMYVKATRHGHPVVARVEHVTRRRYANGTDTAVMLTPVDGREPWTNTCDSGDQVDLASDVEVAEAEQAQRRCALAAALRQLALDIEHRRLPLSSELPTDITIHVDTPAHLERWAEYLGASVRPGGNNPRLPTIRVDGWPLSFWVFGDRCAAPIEMLPPTEWAERDGIRIVDADGWPDEESFRRPIWREEWERRVAASTVERLTHRPEDCPAHKAGDR